MPAAVPRCLVCGNPLDEHAAYLRSYKAGMWRVALCRDCFALGPPGAAAIARKRALEKASLAHRAAQDPASPAVVSAVLRQHAVFLENLANRLENLKGWPPG